MPKRYSRRARALDDSDRLMPEQMSRLRAWAQERCPKLRAGELETELELCLEFHRARGTLIKDVEASCREWLLRGERRRPAGGGRTDPKDALDREAEQRRREEESLRRQRDAEDPEERRRAIEEARGRSWRRHGKAE